MDLMIKEERIKRGWSCEKTAKAIGITKAAYRNIETGIRKPSYDVLIKLLDLFEYNDPRKLFRAVTSESIPSEIDLHQKNNRNI